MALDDFVVATAINETTVELMKQMGLEERELISSNLVSKRVTRQLKRLQAQIHGDQPADSAEEWIELNLGGSSSSGNR